VLAEFLLFDRMTSRHHASIYPRWNDQIQYLTEAYLGYEDAKANGLAHGIHYTVTNPAAQGTLHDVAALLVFKLVGSPSRSAALSLNMLAFLAWQVALLAVFRRTSGSWAVGWMAFGLLPCLFWPWSGSAGSAVDFRLDHAAMCLFGITAAVAVLTRGFRSTGWSALFGAAVGITLVERFLTGAYFAPIFLATAVWILVGQDKRPRLARLTLAALIAAAIAGPIFWVNRQWICNYYWVGHIAGAEGAARAPGLALWDSVRFIFGNLGRMHLGTRFGWTATALSAPLVLLALAPRRAAPAEPTERANRDWLFLGLAFLFLPALVLSVHKQKSEFVLGVLVPGVILLLGWLWSALRPRALAAFGSPRLAAATTAVLATAAVLAGGKFFLERQLWQPHDEQFLAGARRVNQLADYFRAKSGSAGLETPCIGVDQVTDCLDAQIMRVVCYERSKVWMSYRMPLPTGILEEKDETIFEHLAQCDFVLLTDELPGNGYWPYDHQMRRLYPELRNWCDRNLRVVESFPIFGRSMTLFERRDLR
jgi:hypothetical protein